MEMRNILQRSSGASDGPQNRIMHKRLVTDRICCGEQSLNEARRILPPAAGELCEEKLNGDSHAWEATRERLVAAMRAAEFSDRDQFAVQLALAEAFSNAVRHGNAGDSRKHVHLGYAVDSRRVWIRIEDEGDGFAVDRVPDPTLTENLDRTSGRGLFLIRNYMDVVEHNTRGNIVAMVKFRSCP
jgi:serine/threonine-protein kinase RsbW